MACVKDFLKAPAEEVLDCFTKEQLMKVADHFEMDVGDRRIKDNIKAILKANLFEDGVFKGKGHCDGIAPKPGGLSVTGLPGLNSGYGLLQSIHCCYNAS